MSIPTCVVSCKFEDQTGDPVVGARVEAKLNSFEIYDGYVVPEMTVATTDADGMCTLALWPNQLGSVESSYSVTVQTAQGRRLRVTAVVPDQVSANLHEIASLPPFPGKIDGQVAIEAAQAAGDTAMAAMHEAQSSAASAAISQGEAANSSASASASAVAAQASAAAASGYASDAEAHSDAAASMSISAAGHAATAEAAKDAILAIDPMPKSGGTFTGHIAVPAGATGSQVPRASEVVLLAGSATISGIKTFSSSPVVPAGATGSQAPRADEIGALAVAQRALGAVSQLAGVPTGHILETATNANGTYVKLADGTMICWHRATVTDQAISTAYSSLFQGTRTWTFPATFIADPVVKCGEGKWGTGASWPGSPEAVTTTSATLRFLDAISRASGTSFTFSATAHGRWF